MRLVFLPKKRQWVCHRETGAGVIQIPTGLSGGLDESLEALFRKFLKETFTEGDVPFEIVTKPLPKALFICTWDCKQCFWSIRLRWASRSQYLIIKADKFIPPWELVSLALAEVRIENFKPAVRPGSKWEGVGVNYGVICYEFLDSELMCEIEVMNSNLDFRDWDIEVRMPNRPKASFTIKAMGMGNRNKQALFDRLLEEIAKDAYYREESDFQYLKELVFDQTQIIWNLNVR